MISLDFFRGKRVLITGHTGFKGAWIVSVLMECGAIVYGYSLKPSGTLNLYNLLDLDANIESRYGDIRDFDTLIDGFSIFKPEIVIHMAAQPLVRESYECPRYTYDVNVMGTVNVMESIRLTESVKSVIIVTTDKVYKNREWSWGYRENEELNGFDPYSNSKSCAELVVDSYKNSFFSHRDIAISTVRAGNVIGGGDFAVDRIIPDCYRAAVSSQVIEIRNPYSIRPYQHVLEPICAYLKLAELQYENLDIASAYNIGPYNTNCVSTEYLVDLFCEYWNKNNYRKLTKKIITMDGCNEKHEARFLKLDISKVVEKLEWKPQWDIEKTVEETVFLYNAIMNKYDLVGIISKQINDYIN